MTPWHEPRKNLWKHGFNIFIILYIYMYINIYVYIYVYMYIKNTMTCHNFETTPSIFASILPEGLSAINLGGPIPHPMAPYFSLAHPLLTSLGRRRILPGCGEVHVCPQIPWHWLGFSRKPTQNQHNLGFQVFRKKHLNQVLKLYILPIDELYWLGS